MLICDECYHNKVCIDRANHTTAEKCRYYVPESKIQLIRHGRNIAKKNSKGELSSFTISLPEDKLVCSECGLTVRDISMHRIYPDEPFGVFLEFEIKYCPWCGARIDSEEND